MKIENLKLANEIQKKIKDLEDHKKEALSKVNQAEKVDLRLIGENYNYTCRIRAELSPVPFDIFMESYYASIDAEIKRLEVKLEML